MAERVKAEDWDKFEFELYRPLPGTDPDKVDDRVIEDEWEAFNQFAGQIGQL